MLGNDTTLTPGSIVYITVEIVIGLCAIVGNVLVIWVVKLNPGLQNTTFYFIVSLAVADIAVGVLVMPLAIVISLGITIHFYNCLFMTCLLLVFTHASIMALLAIAVDRYLRVKLTIRSSGPQRPGSPSRLLLCFSFQESASSAMQLFLMLLSAVCTDLQRKQNRTCKGSGVGYSGNHSRRTCHQPEIPLRLSILSICVLIMGTGVITTAVVLLKRKQIQKHNWGKVLIKLGDHSLGSSPMVPAPLMTL
ncbi:adenosine receptor A3 isoform X5 [Vombatus ursinus]|uniref:adenosine receptor A3 isoform X5 n=1 Tax=Vombatus ursinus TaxID=29139 RepID=UPI000FFD647E|nr:adenosine receptor A3 isoform X5 [Vombatus ursinus]